MANDICLHPDLIYEVIEELFATDVITQDQVKKLKNDILPVDPNIMMDVRHKEVKKESLIDFSTEKKTTEVIRRKNENVSKESIPKVKDLKTIDKEILNTRKYLAEFNNKLEKRNECLTNTIIDFEKEREGLEFEERMKEEPRESPLALQLDEEETAHYFNLHLDCLEYAMNKNQQKDNVKTWRPIEVKSSPVINVITNFKGSDMRSTSLLSKMEDEIQLLEMCDMRQFHIAGKSLETLSETQTKEQSNNVVPNNSPSFSVSVILDDKNKLTSRQREISQKVSKTWKLYVKRRKIHRWSEIKANKCQNNLIRNCFSLWLSYTQQCKDVEKTNIAGSSETLRIVPSKCCINEKFGLGNIHKVDCGPHQINTQTNVDQVQSETPAVKKLQSEITRKKVFIPSREKKEKHLIENASDKAEVHVKTLTPQDVGLVQHTNTNKDQVCKKHLAKRVQEVKDNISSRSVGEPLLHRFEAQEKIIKQQRELIERQNRIIFDLQAKCLEIESKLNWTLAEKQLTEAEGQVTKGSASSDNKKPRKTESKHLKPSSRECYNIKPQDKTEILVGNMLKRQAYCSQLAEQTKQRKKRIEEERERLKLEQEEQQKQEKEDQKRKKLLQMKIEQQIAQERERNFVTLKKRESELIEKALKHYRNNLLRKSFVALKKISLDVSVQSEDCERIYRNKLIRKMFNFWKEGARHIIQLKYQFAERYYHDRLLKVAWSKIFKVYQDYKIRLQVSEDLYHLKLQERMFHRWQTFVAQQFLQSCCKIELADRLHRRQLLRCYFQHWRDLPRLMFKEREKEQRRRAWRHSVQQLIPDFTPAYIDEM